MQWNRSDAAKQNEMSNLMTDCGNDCNQQSSNYILCNIDRDDDFFLRILCGCWLGRVRGWMCVCICVCARCGSFASCIWWHCHGQYISFEKRDKQMLACSPLHWYQSYRFLQPKSSDCDRHVISFVRSSADGESSWCSCSWQCAATQERSISDSSSILFSRSHSMLMWMWHVAKCHAHGCIL